MVEREPGGRAARAKHCGGGKGGQRAVAFRVWEGRAGAGGPAPKQKDKKKKWSLS